MSTNRTDVVGEYLHEVELRLGGLPLLQRRELLADLESHIAAARAEGTVSEIELIEVLERLGSPEVVAAAAYEENGGARAVPPRPAYVPPPPAAPRRNYTGWIIAAVVAAAVLFLIGLAGLMTLSRSSTQEPAEAPVATVQGPEPATTAPIPAEPTD